MFAKLPNKFTFTISEIGNVVVSRNNEDPSAPAYFVKKLNRDSNESPGYRPDDNFKYDQMEIQKNKNRDYFINEAYRCIHGVVYGMIFQGVRSKSTIKSNNRIFRCESVLSMAGFSASARRVMGDRLVDAAINDVLAGGGVR